MCLNTSMRQARALLLFHVRHAIFLFEKLERIWVPLRSFVFNLYLFYLYESNKLRSLWFIGIEYNFSIKNINDFLFSTETALCDIFALNA